MILVIQNATPGLLDNRTKQPVPTDRHVAVEDSPFWRQRIRQSHVELVRELADKRELAEWRAKGSDHVKAEESNDTDESSDAEESDESKSSGSRKRRRKRASTADVPPSKTEAEKE